MEENPLGGVLTLHAFSYQHFLNILGKVEDQLNALFIILDAIIVIYVQPKLVVITDNLVPPLTKCLLHMTSWSRINPPKS
jgi:hypothetical protein